MISIRRVPQRSSQLPPIPLQLRLLLLRLRRMRQQRRPRRHLRPSLCLRLRLRLRLYMCLTLLPLRLLILLLLPTARRAHVRALQHLHFTCAWRTRRLDRRLRRTFQSLPRPLSGYG